MTPFSTTHDEIDSMELCRGAPSYVPDHTETSVMTDGPPLPDAPQQRLLSHLQRVIYVPNVWDIISEGSDITQEPTLLGSSSQ